MSQSKQNSSLTVAFIIRKYREQKRFTRGQLAYTLNVSESDLQTLEEGKLTRFALADVKAILKRFCYVCDLNSTRVLELCEADYQMKREQEYTQKRQWLRGVWITPSQLMYGLLALCLVLGMGYVGVQTYTFAQQPPLELSVKSKFQTISKDVYTVKGKVNPNYKLFLNGKRVTLSKEGTFKIDFRLKNGYNTLRFQTEKPNGQTTEKLRVLYHS
ncbi:MAG: multiprotein-bridging factor 1 family protein [Candidatus Paceibacteria bacterium]